MKRLKLKYVKITFNDGIAKLFVGVGNVDHIETVANSNAFRITIYHTLLDNELSRTETISYNINDILEIEQRWL